MSVRPRRTGWSLVNAISWRALGQRFSFLFFIVFGIALLVIGRFHPPIVDGVRTHVADSLAPVLDAIARPMLFVEQASQRVTSYLALQTENQKLRAENAQMKQWQNTAAALAHENKELHALLHFKTEPNMSFISARVIADTGGAFARALVVTAGKLDGVREGMAAMSGEGLIGRVVEVGDWSSRVLLLTDLNARLPVIVGDSGERAILAGDNSTQPKLLYLPQDTAVKEGARVLTSGHGGIFPPNLPVGIVAHASHGEFSVEPFAHMGRVSYVSLIDFNLNGGAFNPIAAKIDAGAKE